MVTTDPVTRNSLLIVAAVFWIAFFVMSLIIARSLHQTFDGNWWFNTSRRQVILSCATATAGLALASLASVR